MKVKLQQYLYLRLTNIIHQNNYLATSSFVLNCDKQSKAKQTEKPHLSKNLSILFTRIKPFVWFSKVSTLIFFLVLFLYEIYNEDLFEKLKRFVTFISHILLKYWLKPLWKSQGVEISELFSNTSSNAGTKWDSVGDNEPYHYFFPVNETHLSHCTQAGHLITQGEDDIKSEGKWNPRSIEIQTADLATLY